METPKYKAPYWTVKGRRFDVWEQAWAYWQQHGGVLVETLDLFTAPYVLKP